MNSPMQDLEFRYLELSIACIMSCFYKMPQPHVNCDNRAIRLEFAKSSPLIQMVSDCIRGGILSNDIQIRKLIVKYNN